MNSGKVLPNNGGVLLVPDMWELGRVDGKDDFGAGKELLLQKVFDTFGVEPSGWHDVLTTHNTKKTFLFQKSFHLDLPVIVVGFIKLVKRQGRHDQ